MREVKFRVGGWPEQWCVLRVARTADEVADWVAWVEDRRDVVLGLDSETNAVDPWHHTFRLRAVQTADLTEAWVLPVEDLDETSRWRVSAVLRAHPRWTCHYTEADMRFLTRGLPSSPVRLGEAEPHLLDTQPLLAIYDPRTVTTHNKKDRIDPRIPLRKALKPTATRLLTPALEQAETALHARFRELAPVGHRSSKKSVVWGFANVATDDPAYLLYAALDPLIGCRLFHLLAGALRARGQWGRARAALTEQWVTDQMTLAGMCVDGPYAAWLHGELTATVDARHDYLVERGVRPSAAGPGVGEWLTTQGVAPVRWNRQDDGSRTPSWNRDALQTIGKTATEHAGNPVADRVGEFVAVVDEVRKADKYRSTWVEPMLRTVRCHDGAMHPSMRAIGTVTTRESCQATETSGPLHSAPKRGTTLLRAAVRSRRGWVLVSADLRQGEPFVMAALSGDETFLADLEQGDINSVTATLVYGDAYDPSQGKVAGTPHYDMRQRGKFSLLAACYGAQPPKVATLLGLPESEGGRVLAGWRGRWGRLWNYADEVNAMTAVPLDSGARVPLWDRVWVDEHGELQLRRWPGGGLKPSRLGLNGATQGSQADLLKIGKHRVNHWGWTWALRFSLHDELLGEVPTPFAEEFRLVLERALTITFRGVRVTCEATIDGRTWLPQPDYVDVTALPAVDDEESAE